MASNPMQRKARNSFLMGVILTLVIAACIIVFLYMQMNKYKKDLQIEQSLKTTVYVLNQDVKSGQTITADMFTTAKVSTAGVPANATGDINTLLGAYSLCDKDGNNIYTKTAGDGKEASLYMLDGDKQVDIYVEDGTTDKYYKMNGSQKEYIETADKPVIAKMDLKAKTVITSSMLARSDEMTTDDLRKQEYNMIVLPMDLMTGDYVDIRLMLPNGQDYIVISKKEVEVPIVDGTSYSVDTIWMNLTEDEILTMANAIVEAYMIDGSKLYATKYTDAGMQEAATATYIPSNDVINLINRDPNIQKTAQEALIQRYQNGKDIRNSYIDSQMDETSKDKVPSGMNESIQSTQEERKTYLESLMSGATTTTSGAGTGATTTTTSGAGTGATGTTSGTGTTK